MLAFKKNQNPGTAKLGKKPQSLARLPLILSFQVNLASSALIFLKTEGLGETEKEDQVWGWHSPVLLQFHPTSPDLGIWVPPCPRDCPQGCQYSQVEWMRISLLFLRGQHKVGKDVQRPALVPVKLTMLLGQLQRKANAQAFWLSSVFPVMFAPAFCRDYNCKAHGNHLPALTVQKQQSQPCSQAALPQTLRLLR